MNKRLQELEKQATAKVRCGLNGTSTAKVFNRKKFAELIVRECVDIVEHSRIEGDEGVCLVGATKCKIKQHFGVEK